MEKQLPQRKPTRLSDFDYSTEGAYFVTICTQDRKQILSEIVKVGEGLAPPEYLTILKPCGKIADEQIHLLEERYPNITVMNYVIMPDHIHMIIFIRKTAGGASPSPTSGGKVCGNEARGASPSPTVDDMVCGNEAGGASPSPTLDGVICSFKSLTSRACKKQVGIEKMFQRSFFDHVIRDMEDYETRRKYIYENPMRWYETQE